MIEQAKVRLPMRVLAWCVMSNHWHYWNIKSSTIKLAPDSFPIPPSAHDPITLSVTGPIKAWKNLSDVELVWIYNNCGSRRRLASVDEAAQTFAFQPPYASLATPRDSLAIGWQNPLPSVGIL